MPLFKQQRNETSAKAPVRLTRAEQKEIQAVIRRYKGDGKPHSAQESRTSGILLDVYTSYSTL